MDRVNNIIPIQKINRVERLVYGVVYEPDTPDAHDHFATAEEIKNMAHRFMLQFRKMDEQHDYVEGSGIPVESFIARKGDSDFTEGSWVIVSKVLDESVWKKILKGEIRSYSMAGTATLGKQVEMESDWYDENGNFKSKWDDGEAA